VLRRTIRTFAAGEFTIPALRRAKGDQLVSVCIPAKDEAGTVGAVVEVVVRELAGRHGLVDEVLVVDDRSTDATAAAAAAAGATVVAIDDVLPAEGPGTGKGEALWKSVAASRGDLVVWCDADLVGFGAHFVTGLLGPLLLHPEIAFVKGSYDRVLDGRAGEGGRVTELVARPLLSHLFPSLADVAQPLGGEYAARRTLLEQLPFASGYGVDLALLVDAAALAGADAIAEVDLGTRVHRNRSLHDLSAQAMAILQVALDRAGVARDPAWSSTLVRPGAPPAHVPATGRPPLVDVAGYAGARRRDRARA
jgi:glucosyl-3-phosphoglycerate synthase